jgi:phosphopantothenate-cysteine ligase
VLGLSAKDRFYAPGTRGSTSAEYLLSAGYAVIFLHRQHSLKPFSRHYSHSLNPFLDLLNLPDPGESQQNISVTNQDANELLPVLKAYKEAQTAGTLLQMDFNTVNDYLWILREMAGVMGVLGRRGMFYLAAAVSDFFLPLDRIVSVCLGDTGASKLTPNSFNRRSTRFRV